MADPRENREKDAATFLALMGILLVALGLMALFVAANSFEHACHVPMDITEYRESHLPGSSKP